jgi:hypothetical protein
MKQTGSSTLHSPRLFANAIRKARRLAVRTGANSSQNLAVIMAPGCSQLENETRKASKRPRETTESPEIDLALKSPCDQRHNIHTDFNRSRMVFNHVTSNLSEASNPFADSASFQQPRLPIFPPQELSSFPPMPVTPAQNELVRMLLASLTPQPLQLGGQGHVCSSFLQGAAWATVLCRTPASLPGVPMLPPTFSPAMPSFSSMTVQPLGQSNLASLPPPGSCWPVTAAL